MSSQYTLTMLGLLLLLTCHLALARVRLLPPGTCEVEGQACDIGQDNLLSALPGVESFQQCEAICIDNFDCEFITYFGSDSFPLRNYCMLFNDCTALADCQDCTTAVELCFEQCGQTVEGPLEENVLEVIPGVEEELDCKALCRNQTACQAYTHHNSSDPILGNICFLLTEILAPQQPCEHCSTGFPDCRNITGITCSFSVGGENTPLTAYKFTEPGNTTVTISPLATLGCEMTVMAVGGGGSGGGGSGGGPGYIAGGGSGYVSSTTVPVPDSQLVACVGGPGAESSILSGMGETVLSAKPGHSDGYSNSFGSYGGDGYSGGGAGGSNAGDGGEDGSDGCCDGHGGKGSGFDLASTSLEHFTVSPGAAGERHIINGGAHYRGGGGGVLVDGAGPRDSTYDGEGFGGGHGGYYSGVGTPGIVLMEIKQK